MYFLYPKILYLLLVLPLIIGWYLYRRHTGHATLLYTRERIGKRGWRTKLLALPMTLRLGAIALLIMALARPQSKGGWDEMNTEGIDIMLVMDLSSSMYAMDFSPNRIEAAKRVAITFVQNRPYDHIGLVAFAGESFTASPLTTDHTSLINRISSMQIGLIEDFTAIGLGIVTAINRLRESEAESKVIILLTDGSNNAGDIAPLMAADLAKSFGITIHTIGMGSLSGSAPSPVESFFGDIRLRQIPVDLDEDTMQGIAERTGGSYFRASDDSSLEHVYSKIDKLEKTKLKAKRYHVTSEHYMQFVLWALLLVCIEFVSRLTWLRTNP